MSTLQANKITELTDFKEAAIGAASAMVVFFSTRFFKNNDSLKERVRELENFRKEMELSTKQIMSEHEFIRNTLIDLKNHEKETDIKLVKLDRDIRAINKDIRHTNNNVKHGTEMLETLLKKDII